MDYFYIDLFHYQVHGQAMYSFKKHFQIAVFKGYPRLRCSTVLYKAVFCMDGALGIALYMQHDHETLSNQVIKNTFLSSTSGRVSSKHHLISLIVFRV